MRPEISLIASLVALISLAPISFNDSPNNASTGNFTSSDEYIERGNRLLDEGRYEEALAAYELSIDIFPGAVAYYNKGLALYDLGRYEQALPAFDTAIRIDPTDADAHFMKGLIFSELSRYQDALLEYDKALLINPNDAQAYTEKAWTLALLGRYDEGITASNKAILIEPTADSYWVKAGILNMTGRTDEALAAMEQFHQLNKTRDKITTGTMSNFTSGTFGSNVTTTGEIFLGELYIHGDRYIDIQKPTGVETCIDNNNNRICDVREPNAPPSCRYDGACSNLPGQNVTQPPGFTNGPSSGLVQQTNNSNLYPSVKPQQIRINWLETCMNPLVDYVITEPCSTLTTPDGYTLTSEGERVLRCLAGGALVGILDPGLLIQIRELGPAVGCGG